MRFRWRWYLDRGRVLASCPHHLKRPWVGVGGRAWAQPSWRVSGVLLASGCKGSGPSLQETPRGWISGGTSGRFSTPPHPKWSSGGQPGSSLFPLPLTPVKPMWTEGDLEDRRGPGRQRGIKRMEDLDQGLRSLPGAVRAEEHWVGFLILELWGILPWLICFFLLPPSSHTNRTYMGTEGALGWYREDGEGNGWWMLPSVVEASLDGWGPGLGPQETPGGQMYRKNHEVPTINPVICEDRSLPCWSLEWSMPLLLPKPMLSPLLVAPHPHRYLATLTSPTQLIHPYVVPGDSRVSPVCLIVGGPPLASGEYSRCGEKQTPWLPSLPSAILAPPPPHDFLLYLNIFSLQCPYFHYVTLNF